MNTTIQTVAPSEGISAGASVLFVICNYRGGTLTRSKSEFGVRRIFDALWGKVGFRSHRQLYRDYFANPRQLDYQIDLVASAIESNRIEAPKILLDASFDDISIDSLSKRGLSAQKRILNLETIAPFLQPAEHPATVVLVYPDAIGLSWSNLERTLLGQAKELWILNGRRRMLKITRPIHNQLNRRRFLAESRLAEALLGAGLAVTGFCLATYDSLTGKA